MSTCRQVGKRRHDLASRPPAQLPAEIQRHLAACPACRRTLAALRMTRGLLAVLADAINVVQECGSSTSLRKRNSFNEAWNWIFTKGVTSPLSFDNVCDALGMDARGLRWRLSELVAGRGGGPLRLRLKEASRIQRLTVNRPRRRNPRRMHRVDPAH